MRRFLAIFGICGLIFYSCENAEMKSRDIFAMDTYINLKAYGKNADSALNSAENEIRRLEQLFSVTDENSEIFKINNSKGEIISVSTDTSNILTFSKEMGKATDGCLDISVYPLVKEWGFTTGDYKIPHNSRIIKLLSNVDYSKIDITDNTVAIPENMEIDLGAVAKGYTADRIVEIYKKKGIESGLINLGGNVYAMGNKTDGTKWNVAIVNPLSPDETLGRLEVSDKAVVTSGNYQRYFTGEDGKNYCHIIDTSTGFPADNGLVSVTVISDNGAISDALSTALFVMGKEKAQTYIKNNEDISAVLVDESGGILISEAISEDFQCFTDNTVEVLYDQN